MKYNKKYQKGKDKKANNGNKMSKNRQKEEEMKQNISQNGKK